MTVSRASAAVLSALFLAAAALPAAAQFPNEYRREPPPIGQGQFPNTAPRQQLPAPPQSGQFPNTTPKLNPSDTQLQIAAQVDNACKAAIEATLQSLRPYLADAPDIRDKSNLVLYGPHIEFNAIALYNDRQIIVTKGMCGQLWLVSSALAFAYVFPTLQPRFAEYIRYVNTIDIQLERGPAGMRETEYLTFPLYLGMNVDTLTSEQRSKIDGFTANALQESLGFVLTHEIGHLALHHDPANGGASRELEYAADAYGADLYERAGHSAVASITSLLVFLAREAEMKRQPQASHPRAECRLQKILARSASLEQWLNDTSQAGVFQQRTGMTVPQYRQFMGALSQDCAARP